MSNTDEAIKYIRAIRNPQKKEYATAYAIWLARGKGEESKEPPQYGTLSYMAAQSVRMALSRILHV